MEMSDSDESESESEIATVDECVKCVCEDECELGFMIQVITYRLFSWPPYRQFLSSFLSLSSRPRLHIIRHDKMSVNIERFLSPYLKFLPMHLINVM